jgi:L-ascorbate metabolism protein UlaG (beta-lactamase superfamily)
MDRRVWIAGAAGLAGVGTVGYRSSPFFWRQILRDKSYPIRPAPLEPKPQQWPDRGLFAAWLGHATVLLKIDGFTILTDPMFSERAGVDLKLFTVGIKRLVAPALDLARLPKIDLVLLSHAHMDHFDLPSLRKLESKTTAVITASKTSDLLRVNRYREVRELGWWERTRFGPAEVRAMEVRHWGARLRNDTWRGYNGYLIEAGRYRVLFGGDTALTSAFRILKDSRPIDLAIMPIGTYNPWVRNHCTPEQAWRMGNDAGANFFLPVHHQTFPLSHEPVGEPIQRFHEAAGSESGRVALDRIGAEWRWT